MTCRERLKLKHSSIEYNNVFTKEGVEACPVDYKYLPRPDYCDCSVLRDIGGTKCHDCWNRTIPGIDENTCYFEGLEYKVQPAKPIAKVVDVKEENGGLTVTTEPIIKDSGERTQFSTGAQRDMHAGKGDMVSVPWEAILRLSVHYENGAAKYERWNFRKGIPVSSFIDSACRHLAKYQCGCDDEDHLAAAAFNVLGAMLMENTMPDMVDLPLRKDKNTFDYFKE